MFNEKLFGVKKIKWGLITLILLLCTLTLPLGSGYLLAETNTNNITFISAGLSHTVALKPDGTVWTWGSNGQGELGIGSYDYNPHPIPTQVKSLTDVSTVAASEQYTLALKNDGTVWEWGFTGAGSDDEGNPTSEMFVLPHQVENLTGIEAIACGGAHSLALKNDGTVWSWGGNWWGQLGDGTTKTSYKPVQVKGLNNITAIAAGSSHSLAIKDDGTVWAWGCNSNGQLGNGNADGFGNLIAHPLATRINGIDGIVAVSGGWQHSAALDNLGRVYTWGYNKSGQLGDGTTIDRTLPTLVPNLSEVKKVCAARVNTYVLKKDGTVWAWGSSCFGQIAGIPKDENPHPSPIKVQELTGVMDLSSSGCHAVAIDNYGYIWAWGSDEYGQLGMSTPSYSTNSSSNENFYVGLRTKIPGTTYDIEYSKGAAPASSSVLGVSVAQSAWKSWGQNINLNKTRISFKGTPGVTYYFRVRPRNKDGSVGKWTTVQYRSIVPYDNNSLISARKGFSQLYNNSTSGYYLGTLRYSTKSNEEITYKFTGNHVALIGNKGPGYSKAKIYIDGQYKTTINAYSETNVSRKRIFSTSWKIVGTHTLKIVNLGTQGRSRFDIDGLAVGR